jgi:hemoglobin
LRRGTRASPGSHARPPNFGKDSVWSITVEAPSLYELLGGAEAIAGVVDDFYVRVLGDDTLKGMFVAVDMERLRRHQRRFISYALGGPNQYSGRNMQKAREGLNISPAQFAAVAGHLSDSLASFGVSTFLIEQVIRHVAQLQDDVVGR